MFQGKLSFIEILWFVIIITTGIGLIADKNLALLLCAAFLLYGAYGLDPLGVPLLPVIAELFLTVAFFLLLRLKLKKTIKSGVGH